MLKKNNKYMSIAINEAKKACDIGEVPVGAVIVDVIKEEVISKAHNLVKKDKNPINHAEILAITQACEKIQDSRLENCDLYVTLEPCAMCAGAISHAKIRRLYFGAYDPKGGGVEHGAMVFNKKTCNHKIQVYGGIMQEQCSQLLKAFFAKLRTK